MLGLEYSYTEHLEFHPFSVAHNDLPKGVVKNPLKSSPYG